MKEVSPKEAHDVLSKDPNAVLVDVRSVPEFEGGHPKGALNVPIANKSLFGMSPNADFLAVMTACVPKDRKVFLTCMSGQRSARAGGMLEQSGWKDVTNVRAGWGGAKDMGGNIVEPGWAASGLPTDKGAPAGLSYDELKKKAK